MGMDYITFTDHDTIEAYELLGWDREKLISGVEMSVDDPEFAGHELHVNVFELDREEFFELREIAEIERNLKSFVRYLKKRKTCLSFITILSGLISIRSRILLQYPDWQSSFLYLSITCMS